MASPPDSKKRATAIEPSPDARDNKRVHYGRDEEDGDGTATVIEDVAVLTDNLAAPEHPVCATLARGYGPVWAIGRQDLCEAQPYFKAYQGGMHSSAKIALGLYISKYSEPRDVLDRNVLITCV